MERKKSKILEEIKKKFEENPIIQHLEPDPPIYITKHENVKELQELLIQTCIDYINKNNLTDIYAVSFSADDLMASAKEKKWASATDSYIKVSGINHENFLKKDNTIFKMPFTYTIGESY